jgi:hypothetical protein
MKKSILLLLVFLGSWVVKAQETKNTQSKVVHPTKITKGEFLGTIGPLRDMPQVSISDVLKKAKEEFERNEDLKDRQYPYQSTALPKGEDPVWQKYIPKGVKNSIEIINQFGGVGSYSHPIDPNGAAGPNHYMMGINVYYQIFDKNGNSITNGDFNTLFNNVTGSDNNDGDPIVLYDDLDDRWLVAEFSISSQPYHMLIAFSATNDPTGQWYAYSFEMPGFPDYMKFGIWPDGLYMATNTYNDDDVFAFEKSVMLNGGSNPTMLSFDNPYRPASGFHCIMPLDNDGDAAPAGTPGQFITINDDAWGGGSDALWLFELHADWNTPSNSTFARTQVINVPAFESELGGSSQYNYQDNIPQPGTNMKLDGIPQILMFRAQYRNFGNEQTIVACHTVDVDGSNHAGIRWYELTNTGSGWSLRQAGTYAPDNEHRWMGSIAMNGNHEIALGYSLSSTNTYPSIRIVGQSAAEHANASGILDIPETNVITSDVSKTGDDRWGDYSEMSVDPSDDRTFWYIGTVLSSQYSDAMFPYIVSFRFQDQGDPVNLTANAVSENEIDLSWNLNDNNDPVLLAWSPNGTFGTPQNGTTYSPGDAIPGGGTVLYYGTNTSFNHTGLQENTTYYYKAWSYLPSNEYSPGVTTNATTPSGPINSFPFTLDFENSTDYTTVFAPWTTVDGDGKATYGSSDCDFPGEQSAFAYMAFNTSDCWESTVGGSAHSGVRVGMAVCPSDQSQSDDWFISPQLELGTNSSFSFWAMSPKPGSWGNDEFEVLVSTTDNNPSSFTAISSVTEAPASWQQFTYDLSAYDNQSVYVAIHHVSTDKFLLWIDDLEVNSTVVVDNNNSNLANLIVMPNPASESVKISAPQVINNVILTSLEGKTILNRTINAATTNINITSLSKGIYLLKVVYKDGTSEIKKLVKE